MLNFIAKRLYFSAVRESQEPKKQKQKSIIEICSVKMSSFYNMWD